MMLSDIGAQAVREIATITITVDPSKKVRRMLGLSLHGWENAMVVFLIIAGLFALVAGVATWAVVHLQRIEIAKSEDDLERYKLNTAKEISEANARAAEARLELEKFKLPRDLSAEQLGKLTATVSKFSGTIFDVGAASTDPEHLFLLSQIVYALKDAGWTLVNWQGPGQVISGGSIGASTGLVSIVGVGIYVNPDAKLELWPAVESLKTFFGEIDIAANAGRMAVSGNTNSGSIHIMVGRKM
jgi:hypothetical protein